MIQHIREKTIASAKILGSLVAVWSIFAVSVLSLSSASAATVTYTKSTSTVNGLKMTIFTKPTNNGGALRITSFDGHLWFAEHANGQMVKFRPSGIAETFTIPHAGARVLAVTRGPGRKVWFPIFNQGVIGNVTSTGQFQFFTVSGSDLKSNSIITGPDNRLWFATDFHGIGRTTASTGATTFFPIADNNDQPTALTVGPDNKIWYIEWDGNHVGKMTTAGAFTEYPIGFSGFSNSFGIAADPTTNRIWFCDPQRTRIGRISTAGTGLQFYTAGLDGHQPSSIIRGPDGRFYFGTYNNAIGRISRTGVIRIYPIPPGQIGPGGFPVLGLTVGPDKNIWFTNNQNSQVGRLRLPEKSLAEEADATDE